LSRSPEEAPGELKYDQVPLSREEPLLRAMMSYNFTIFLSLQSGERRHYWSIQFRSSHGMCRNKRPRLHGLSTK